MSENDDLPCKKGQCVAGVTGGAILVSEDNVYYPEDGMLEHFKYCPECGSKFDGD